MTKDGLYNQG
jgi:hypothetical protein